MNSYIQAIPLWLLYKWKVWELLCKINIQKVHNNDTWGTYKINSHYISLHRVQSISSPLYNNENEKWASKYVEIEMHTSK